MDPLEFLAVRFHFDGQFYNDGRRLHYIGGKEELSFVEIDKMSLLEIQGHLKDHYNCSDPVTLHWLFPRKMLSNGLRVLMDDKAIMDMCQAITDGGAADIFVERVLEDDAEQSVNLEKLSGYISSPKKIEKEVAQFSKYIDWIRDSDDGNEVVKAKKSLMQQVLVNDSALVGEGYSSDSDHSYLPGDDESSEDDEEVGQIRADLKELKKKLSDRGMVVVDDQGHEVNVENLMPSNPLAEGVGVESDSTKVDIDEDADSYDQEEGEVIRKKREFPRFDGSAPVPTFSLGMSFPHKATFKEAVIKYGLAARKVIKFSRMRLPSAGLFVLGLSVHLSCTFPRPLGLRAGS